ncbi:MAG: putative quinol monooxygenase [Burkholderiales bacterium]
MHVIIVKWKIKPQYVAEFEREMREHVAATKRSESGCVQFEVATDNADPRTFHLFEIYRDDQAIADHAKSPTLAAIRSKIPEWVEERSLANATLWPRMGDR